MNIVVIDNDEEMLARTAESISKEFPASEIKRFTDPYAAVQYGVSHPVAAVFATVEMRRLDGFSAVRLIRQHKPEIRVVFISEEPDYALDAFENHASGYILKPVTPSDIKKLDLRWREAN